MVVLPTTKLTRAAFLQHIIKIKIHSSCEIEDFVETHLCKLCVILRSRALYAMSSLLIARVILLREVNGTVFRRGRLRRVCDGSAVYHVCLCFLFNLLLSQMSDFMPMILTVPLWGSEVANSKTDIHLTNTAGEVGMRCHIYAMLLLLNTRVTLLR